MIKVQKIVVNPLPENMYVLSDETGECIFVDPGCYYPEEQEAVKNYVEEHRLNPVKIVNTHCHFDHIFGVEFLRKEYEIPFLAHQEDAFLINGAAEQAKMFGFSIDPIGTIDAFIDEQDLVRFGNSTLQVFHVPGHSPGHVVFYSEPDGFLIAGDVLFHGSIGRTDLPGGDYQTLVAGIKEKLLPLPGKTTVYCGHGPETNIGFEKENNPFLC